MSVSEFGIGSGHSSNKNYAPECMCHSLRTYTPLTPPIDARIVELTKKYFNDYVEPSARKGALGVVSGITLPGAVGGIPGLLLMGTIGLICSGFYYLCEKPKSSTEDLVAYLINERIKEKQDAAEEDIFEYVDRQSKYYENHTCSKCDVGI